MNSKHKCNKPDADCKMVIDSQTQKSHIVDFEGWLENELEVLEAKFADFATKNSTRMYFSR